MSAETIDVYVITVTSGRIRRGIGGYPEFVDVNWQPGMEYPVEEYDEALAYFEDRKGDSVAAWNTENRCSNGRFSTRGGAFGVALEKVTREWDEYNGEFGDEVGAELVSQSIYDGKKFREDL